VTARRNRQARPHVQDGVDAEEAQAVRAALRVNCTAPAGVGTLAVMRNLETIASELRLISALRRTAAEVGAPAPRIDVADELLDE
jgi:hypothetical protein